MPRTEPLLRHDPSSHGRANAKAADAPLAALFEQSVREAKALAERDRSSPRNDQRALRARPGDTLWDIAEQRHLTLKQLLAANPQFDPAKADGVLEFDRRRKGQWDPDYLRPGDLVRLPAQPHKTHVGHATPRRPAGAPLPGAKSAAPPSNERRSVDAGPGAKSSPPAQSAPAAPAPAQPQPTTPAAPPASVNPTAPPQTLPSTPPTQTPNPGPTTAPTQQPNQQPQGTGWTGWAYPVLRAITPERFGFGPEFAVNPFKGAAGRLTTEVYGKSFWQFPGGFGLAIKVKYTPRADVGLTLRDASGKLRVAMGADEKGNKLGWKGLLPKKLSADVGLVGFRSHEVGGTIEYDVAKKRINLPGGYWSLKEKSDPLISTAQVKAGKTHIGAIAKAIKTARTTGDWSPVRNIEVQISLEQKHGLGGHFLTTESPVKTTIGDVIDRFNRPTPTPAPSAQTPSAQTTSQQTPRPQTTQQPGSARVTTRGGRLAGFTAGTVASFAGDALARGLGSDRIQNATLRNAVNATAAATTGVATDYAVTRGVSTIAPKIASAAAPLAQVAGRVAAPVAQAVSKVAAPVARAASKLPLASVGRAAGALGRFGGPAGALLAGVPDGIDAYSSFKAGNTAKGVESTVKAGVKVGATAAGAVIGQAVIPIPVVGAAVGGVVGSVVGDLATSDTAMKVYSAVGDAAVTAGKAVGEGFSKAAKWVGGLFG